jgi:Skp family chaperone for outer membrane proteins
MSAFCRVFLLFSAVLFLSFPVAAAAPVTVGYVDVQKILTETKAAKDIQDQVQKQREQFVEDLAKQEQDLSAEKKKIEEDAASLSKEELAARKKEFEAHFQDARKIAQKRKEDLEAALAKSLNKLKEELYKVVETLAGEKGYTLVISKQAVVLADPAADMTAETMERLNKNVSKIRLDVSSK